MEPEQERLSKLYSGSGVHSLSELNYKLNPSLFQHIYKFKTPYGILKMLPPPYWQQEGGVHYGFGIIFYCRCCGWCSLPLYHQMVRWRQIAGN